MKYDICASFIENTFCNNISIIFQYFFFYYELSYLVYIFSIPDKKYIIFNTSTLIIIKKYKFFSSILS